MKLARADLALFRWPMLLLAVALALMSLLVWASHGEYQRSQARAKEAERANMRARSELLEVRAVPVEIGSDCYPVGRMPVARDLDSTKSP